MSNIVTTDDVYAPGSVKWREPIGMRAADHRYGDDRVGEYHLAHGQTVYVEWLIVSQTHSHIAIWDAERILATKNNVVRVQAARLTEAMLLELEA